MGASIGALAHGVPLVLLPHMADHFRNADAVARAGYGVALDEGDQTSTGVLEAVRKALEDRTIVSAAAAGRAEIASMPTPSDAVETIRAMVSSRRRRLSSSSSSPILTTSSVPDPCDEFVART